MIETSIKIKTPAPWKKSYDKPRLHSKAETSFADKAPHKAVAAFLQWSSTDVRVGPQRGLSAEEWMLLNCGVGEDS